MKDDFYINKCRFVYFKNFVENYICIKCYFEEYGEILFYEKI